MTALYRFYGEYDDLLYVGISNHLLRRVTQHDNDKGWWSQVRSVTVEHHRSRDDAHAAEKAAIRAEWPRYNIVHHPREEAGRVCETTGRTILSLRDALGFWVDEAEATLYRLTGAVS